MKIEGDSACITYIEVAIFCSASVHYQNRTRSSILLSASDSRGLCMYVCMYEHRSKRFLSSLSTHHNPSCLLLDSSEFPFPWSPLCNQLHHSCSPRDWIPVNRSILIHSVKPHSNHACSAGSLPSGTHESCGPSVYLNLISARTIYLARRCTRFSQ